MFVDLQTTTPPADHGVTIDLESIRRVATELADHPFPTPRFDYAGVPDVEGEDWARFVVLGVSVVWRLWPPAGAEMWSIETGGTRLEDASAVWGCFAREPHALDLTWQADGHAATAGFFAGSGTLQDTPRRHDLLASVARTIQTRWDGSVLALIEQGKGDAGQVSELLVETIPGYLDRPRTAVGILPFDKLAHLAVAMLAAKIPIDGLDRFPVYPDYMLPRHLRHLGVLVYERGLADAVDSRTLIEKESSWELAIRWGTVRAAALLREALVEQGNPVTTPQLDFWLWSEAVLGPHAHEMGEHHRTITEAY